MHGLAEWGRRLPLAATLCEDASGATVLLSVSQGRTWGPRPGQAHALLGSPDAEVAELAGVCRLVDLRGIRLELAYTMRRDAAVQQRWPIATGVAALSPRTDHPPSTRSCHPPRNTPLGSSSRRSAWKSAQRG